jgi:KUP system potassium uptake protein
MNPSTSISVSGTEGTLHSAPTAGFWGLMLGSIGVVYGDIGTSPLYAMRESVVAAVGAGNPASEPVVLGILSLVIWALLIVVTAKYVLLLLHADNNGEGGTLALMALAQRGLGRAGASIILLGIISGALFYGDAVITPALSVLSAIEGLKIVTPALDAYVVPITVVILFALFLVQSRGTASIAAFFGPITLIWSITLACAGIWHVAQNPIVLTAINPLHGIDFLIAHRLVGFLTLGAVFLVVTGSEALYADLGHFGRRPIQAAWLFVALPALTINYLGQGALILADPKNIENPFFLLYPEWALLPMVALATAATVIASQAVITGAYSLTQQAISLGLLPRFVRSDLHAAREYIAADRRAPPRVVVPLLQRARICLWNSGYRYDGRDQHAGVRRDLEGVALVSARGCVPYRTVSRDRPDLSQRQHAEDI